MMLAFVFFKRVQVEMFYFLQESVQTEIEQVKPILYKVGLGMGYLELPQGE